MTLRHFKIFITVCSTMSMTAAAEELYMSQPAVSQVITDLEKFYSVRLFERYSRKLYLTEAGEKLRSYAHFMIRLNDDIEKAMKAIHDNGEIRIGSSLTIGGYVIPGMVSAFLKKHPKTTVEVLVDNTERIEKKVLLNEIDLALVEGETVSQDVLSIPYMEDELVLICGSGHRFAALSSIEPCELEKENLIIREKGSGTRRTFEDVMAANHLKWSSTWACSNAESVKMAVSEGMGVSVLSKRAVQNEVKLGLLCIKRLNGIRFDRKFKIIYHKDKFLTKTMKEFIDFCLDTVGKAENS